MPKKHFSITNKKPHQDYLRMKNQHRDINKTPHTQKKHTWSIHPSVSLVSSDKITVLFICLPVLSCPVLSLGHSLLFYQSCDSSYNLHGSDTFVLDGWFKVKVGR
jgi:hypothetical protein